MKRTVAGAVFCLSVSWLSAAELVTALVAPVAAVPSGARTEVTLVVFNPSPGPQSYRALPTLRGHLLGGDQPVAVTLNAVSPGAQVVPEHGFLDCHYTVAIPRGASGRTILQIGGVTGSRIQAVVMITGKSSAPVVCAKAPVEEMTNPVTTAAASIQRSFAGRFSAHDPVYFIYGPDAPGAKFQFSFKYQVLSFTSSGEAAPARTLQFGYTQRSLWDITANSSPFYDTSYMPSFFYESLAAKPKVSDGGFTWLGFQTGYQHESNGQGGEASRSMNTLFFRPGFALGKLDGWNVIVAPRIFFYIGGVSDNPMIKDYRGYGEWLVSFGRNNGPALAYTGRMGRHFNHFTTELDLTIPVHTRILDFGTYLLIQYFNGYGESLRAYDKHSSTIRAGFSLVR